MNVVEKTFVKEVLCTLTTVYMSRSELNDFVKDKMGLEGDVHVHLDDTYEKDSEGWVVVPSSWSTRSCPDDTAHIIEIERRHGGRAVGYANTWSAGWVQEGHPLEIVKYRHLANRD